MIPFLFPLALVAFPLGVYALMRIYRKHGVAQQRIISSALFVQMLKKKSSARSKFRPPLRFFLEALLLLCLAVGLAGFYLSGDRGAHTLVLDNSMSMAMRDVTEVPSRTKFDKAKDRALRYLEELPFAAQVELWITSPRPKMISRGEVSSSQARSILDDVELVQQKDRLEQLLSRILSRKKERRTYVVTDKLLNPDQHIDNLKVETIRNKNSRENISINGIRYEEESTGGLKLLVDIGSYSTREQSVTIVLSGTTLSSDLRLQKMRQAKELFVADEVRTISFANLDSAKAYKVELVPGKTFEDALPQDNVAWYVPQVQDKVIAYEGNKPLRELGLRRLPSFVVRKSTDLPQTVTPLFTIYYGTEADTTTSNALVILPPRGELRRGGATSTWQADHPLSLYVNFSEFSLPYFLPLKTPRWAETVASTTEGVAVYAGFRDGRKEVVYGFDPFPYGGKETPIRSVLLLNTFSWLSKSDITRSYLQPGDKVSAASSSAQGRYQDDRRVSLVRNGEEQYFLIDEPGIVSLDGDYRAVNFFDATESNPELQKFSLSVSSDSSSTLSSLADKNILSRPIAFLVVILLLLDLLFFDLLPWRRRA